MTTIVFCFLVTIILLSFKKIDPRDIWVFSKVFFKNILFSDSYLLFENFRLLVRLGQVKSEFNLKQLSKFSFKIEHCVFPNESFRISYMEITQEVIYES